MTASPQFFISYDKTYRRAAIQLHAELQNELRGKFGRDIDVFIDQEDIETGREWLRQIDDALAGLYVLVVLVNDAFVTREYCCRELNAIAARIARGEPCRIVTVRFQDDSEIYRASNKAELWIKSEDARYLATLSEAEKAVVADLRRIQFVDGVALRGPDPRSEEYQADFAALAAAVAEQYRQVSRQPPPKEPAAREAEEEGAAAEPKPQPRSWAGLLAAALVGLFVLVALSEFVFPPTKGWITAIVWPPPGPPGPEPGPGPGPGPGPTEPVWQTASVAVLTNKSTEPATAFEKPDRAAGIADVIGPGVDRPERDIGGEIREARIKDELWYAYPLAGDVSAYVPAKSLGIEAP